MQLTDITPLRPLHGFRALGGFPPRGAEALAVLCSFGFQPPCPRGRLRNLLSAYAWRNFLATRVRYVANPRTAEQQAEYCRALAQELDLRLELAMHDPQGARPGLGLPQLDNAGDILARAEGRLVLLSYADPLGLGMGTLERALLRASRRAAIHILNGRGRLLCLDGPTHGLLTRHRVLARWRLPELAFATACLVMAPALALCDATRRSRSHQ